MLHKWVKRGVGRFLMWRLKPICMVLPLPPQHKSQWRGSGNKVENMNLACDVRSRIDPCRLWLGQETSSCLVSFFLSSSLQQSTKVHWVSKISQGEFDKNTHVTWYKKLVRCVVIVLRGSERLQHVDLVGFTVDYKQSQTLYFQWAIKNWANFTLVRAKTRVGNMRCGPPLGISTARVCCAQPETIGFLHQVYQLCARIVLRYCLKPLMHAISLVQGDMSNVILN